jgi:hypothetical protein
VKLFPSPSRRWIKQNVLDKVLSHQLFAALKEETASEERDKNEGAAHGRMHHIPAFLKLKWNADRCLFHISEKEEKVMQNCCNRFKWEEK